MPFIDQEGNAHYEGGIPNPYVVNDPSRPAMHQPIYTDPSSPWYDQNAAQAYQQRTDATQQQMMSSWQTWQSQQQMMDAKEQGAPYPAGSSATLFSPAMTQVGNTYWGTYGPSLTPPPGTDATGTTISTHPIEGAPWDPNATYNPGHPTNQIVSAPVNPQQTTAPPGGGYNGYQFGAGSDATGGAGGNPSDQFATPHFYSLGDQGYNTLEDQLFNSATAKIKSALAPMGALSSSHMEGALARAATDAQWQTLQLKAADASRRTDWESQLAMANWQLGETAADRQLRWALGNLQANTSAQIAGSQIAGQQQIAASQTEQQDWLGFLQGLQQAAMIPQAPSGSPDSYGNNPLMQPSGGGYGNTQGGVTNAPGPYVPVPGPYVPGPGTYPPAPGPHVPVPMGGTSSPDVIGSTAGWATYQSFLA